jgi:uncharacterized membrane protein
MTDTKEMEEAVAQNNQTGYADGFRFGGFSDAVFAIIITLLAVEIHRPNAAPGELGLALLHAWTSYLAFILGFIYTGVVWLNHQALFQRVKRVDHRLLLINLGILGTSSLLPFSTGVLATAFETGTLEDQQSAVVLYAAIAGLMSAAWLPVFPYLHRKPHLAHGHVAKDEFRGQYSRPVVGVVAYLAASILGWFVNPWLAIVIFVAMVIYHGWTSQGLKA